MDLSRGWALLDDLDVTMGQGERGYVVKCAVTVRTD